MKNQVTYIAIIRKRYIQDSNASVIKKIHTRTRVSDRKIWTGCGYFFSAVTQLILSWYPPVHVAQRVTVGLCQGRYTRSAVVREWNVFF